MLFTTDEDDPDFTLQAGSSKLASLFVGPENSNAENSALTYTAPRQPASKNDDNQQAAVTMSLLCATAVHAFKFEKGKHVSQGKLGMAIIGHHDSSLYKLILYKGKQQQVTVATINQNFQFLVQPKCYVSFRDEFRTNWLVKFETEESLADMAKQVALAKANCAGRSLNTVIVQDLSPGEGQCLEKGTVAVLKYTGWLLTNRNFGKVFDSNADSDQTLKVKLGRGKLIKGWEDGLIGAKRNGRRLLIVPPALGYGTQGYGSAVPPDSTLIFEVCVTKLKHSQDSTRSSTPVLSIGGDGDGNDVCCPEMRSLSQSTDDSIRARGESLSELLTLVTTSVESEKARIISRMAKMGTPMLPLKGAVLAQPSSESENEDDQLQRVAASTLPPQAPFRSESPKPPVKPKSIRTIHVSQPAPPPVAAPCQGIPSAQQMAVFQAQPQFPTSMASYGYQPMMLPSQMGSVGTSITDSQVPLLLSEARSQSMEVRHNMDKLSDKVDIVLSRLDSLRPQPSLPMGSFMDGEILLSNIQRIVQENTKLKEESQEKTNKIQVLNDKIYELLQRNQRLMEESQSMLEQKSDSLQGSAAESQAQLLTLQREKLEVTSRLNEALAQVTSLRAELEEKQRKDSQMQEQLSVVIDESQKNLSELEGLRSLSQEKEQLLSRIQNSLADAERQKHELEVRLLKLQGQVSELESTKRTLEKSVLEMKSKVEADQMLTSEERKGVKVTHKLEADAHDKTKAECEERLAENQEDLSKQLQLLEEEKQALQNRLREIQHEKANSEALPDQLLSELRREVEDLRDWKAKYEQLSSSTENMKKAYEERIRELVNENRNLRSTRDSPAAEEGFDFETELKKIMNTLFRLLQKEFGGAGPYSGNEVVQTILDVIREYTMQVIMVKQSQTPPVPPSSSGMADGSGTSSASVPQTSEAESKEEESKSKTPDLAEKSDDEQAETATEEQTQAASVGTIPEEETVVSSAVVTEADAAQNASSEGSAPESKSTVEPKESTKKQEPDWSWKPQPPPPPLFDDDDEEDEDWLK